MTLIASVPPYWEPMLNMFYQRIGDPSTEEEMLKERSPLFSAEKINIPMLIGQGANDPRVKQAESEQIVAALKANEQYVEYVVYPDEGHGLARPENRLSFYAVAEAFLAESLGGRCQDVEGDFRGSSIRVVAGTEHIPRLREEVENALLEEDEPC